MTFPSGVIQPQANPAPVPTGAPAAPPPQAQPPAGQPAGGAPAVPAAPAPQSAPATAPQVGLTGDTVLQGDAIPAELRGLTFNDMLRLYGGMRQVILTNHSGAGTGAPSPAAAPQSGQPAVGSPSTPSQTPPVAAPQAPSSVGAPNFYTDPIGSIEQVVRRVVGEVAAPILQDRQAQQVAGIEQQMVREFPDFAQFAPAIAQSLAGAPPEALANPELIRTAYWVAKGRAASMQPPAPAPAAPTAPVIGPDGRASAMFPPQATLGNPVPNMMPNFFTESSSTPQSVGAAQLTSAEAAVASAMNMSHDQYRAWKGGISVGAPR
jgi:hypothetical protein